MYIQYSPNGLKALRTINILYSQWPDDINVQFSAMGSNRKIPIELDNEVACYLLFTRMFYVYFTYDFS